MLDVLFKSYFVFFRKKVESGVSAAVFLLSIPLSLNILLVVLLTISSFFNVSKIGGMFFGILTTGVAFATGMLLRRIYVTNARYKLIRPITRPFMYYLIGLVHYIFSVIFFVAILILLLNKTDKM